MRAITRRNSYALVWAQFGLAHVIMFGGLLLLKLYQPVTDRQFWTLVIVSQLLVSLDNLVSIRLTRRMGRPAWAWERGARDEGSTIEAWVALATLPVEYFRRMRKYPFLFVYLPFVAFMTWELKLKPYSFLILAVAGTVGDGLLGVFGVPDRHPDHADRAVAAALRITELVYERYAGRVAVGIGVNSGQVVAGTVGGGGRVGSR